MYHYFCLNKDEFLAHYHRRSNVESTFSMVKAKFRDHVRSKTDTAMINEVLTKFLCHNLCCLITAVHEMGLEPVFWEGGQSADPQVPRCGLTGEGMGRAKRHILAAVVVAVLVAGLIGWVAYGYRTG